MMTQGTTRALEPVEEAGRAELLLHPLRQKILAEARQATTSAEIARRIGLPAQKVNYHVRTLVEAGFLRPAGQGLKRNLVEKRYQASAQSYLLLPQVLGAMGPDALDEADRFSATHLMRLSARLQRELATWLSPTMDTPRSVPTLSVESEVRFESASQRAAFAGALQAAVSRVVAEHTSPATDTSGNARPGRAYRLVVGCYPVPNTHTPSDPEATPSSARLT